VTDPNRPPLMLNQETLHGPLGEAYRLLYANLGFNCTEHPPKTIAVISALSKEGRTMTAVNLGIVIAEAGHRVVLIEADLRRPAIGKFMAWEPWRPVGQGPVHGLNSIITGAATVEEALRPAPFERLSVLPAGPIPPNLSAVIGSQRMKDVLAKLAQLFDYVVLDTPPCLLYADALLISSMVDGVVYVVRAGPQDRAAQQRAQKQLQHSKARVLGAVFNDVAAAEIARYGGQHANGHTPSGRVVLAGGKLHPPGSSIERAERSRWDRLLALCRLNTR
jgi:succinoglycan biosynthesis transport protein ExoP